MKTLFNVHVGVNGEPHSILWLEQDLKFAPTSAMAYITGPGEAQRQCYSVGYDVHGHRCYVLFDLDGQSEEQADQFVREYCKRGWKIIADRETVLKAHRKAPVTASPRHPAKHSSTRK
jgi:hypothetical protein